MHVHGCTRSCSTTCSTFDEAPLPLAGHAGIKRGQPDLRADKGQGKQCLLAADQLGRFLKLAAFVPLPDSRLRLVLRQDDEIEEGGQGEILHLLRSEILMHGGIGEHLEDRDRRFAAGLISRTESANV